MRNPRWPGRSQHQHPIPPTEFEPLTQPEAAKGARGADAAGGAKAARGADAAGGAKAARGADAAGGAKAARGADAAGGAKAARGADAAGGAKAARGADAAGGAKAARGADAAGGAEAVGGTDAAGGAEATVGADRVNPTSTSPPGEDTTETPSDLRQLQREDTLWQPLIDVLEGKAVQGNIRLWKALPSYHLDTEGILCYQPPGTTPPRAVIPRALVPQLIAECHSHPMAGHYHARAVLDRLKRRFYWPSMTSDVNEYCASCVKCHSSKNNRRDRPAQTRSHPTFLRTMGDSAHRSSRTTPRNDGGSSLDFTDRVRVHEVC